MNFLALCTYGWVFSLANAEIALGSPGHTVQVLEVAKWLTHRGKGPHPAHWAVTNKTEVEVSHVIGRGCLKLARKGVVTSGNHDVVVKYALPPGSVCHQQDAFRHLRAELLYFEYMRGHEGVPLVYGGWFEDDQLFYVVQNAGVGIAQKEYAAFKRLSPLGAATALLRCFESFSQHGGFFLQDLNMKQFSIKLPLPVAPNASKTAEIFLVDTPNVMSDPITSFVRKHGLGQDVFHIPTRGKCHKHTDCKMAQHKGVCKLQGPGLVGHCQTFTAKTHIFEVADEAWALPSILQAATDTGNYAAARMLAKLIKKMRVDRPSDRPTFSEAIAELEVVGVPSLRLAQSSVPMKSSNHVVDPPWTPLSLGPVDQSSSGRDDPWQLSK